MKKILFSILICFSLTVNASDQYNYPKLKDLINTIGSKDEFTVIVPNNTTYGREITYMDESYRYIKLVKRIEVEKDIPVKKVIFRNDVPSVLNYGINIKNNNYDVTYYGYKEILGINVVFTSKIKDLNRLSEILKDDLLKNGFILDDKYIWYKDPMGLFKEGFSLRSPFNNGDVYSKDNVSIIIKDNNWGSDSFIFEIVQRDYFKKLNEMLDNLSNLENDQAEKEFKDML